MGTENVANESGDNVAGAAEPGAGRVTRRRFLESGVGVLIGLGTVSVVSTILSYLRPMVAPASQDGPVAVAAASQVPVGDGQVVPFQGTTAIVIHREQDWVAFSAVCTHAGCIVRWDKAQRRILCPCHAGVFDVEGNVVSGPPPRPLRRYRVKVQGDKIMLAEG
jgi:cytochrome b6-f complex iron-sulfur subunit